ncbi:hypothetical protein CY34DRAFT_23943 [Suillus luteus UH-Slu-Lm8-n1]|uniref:Protein kinase domain-containing protein n=1 Tax=Suillus luteus UH-Slu-Lm8-n1 TaxID=930992 RepID=A0A0D0AXK8_9AGAM|nr:hypothetical protein CY34DRAFT_23943 [Suillus luteus UH-Slu-Lm8-n1]
MESKVKHVDQSHMSLYRNSGSEDNIVESLDTINAGNLLQVTKSLPLYHSFLSMSIIDRLQIVVQVCSEDNRSINPPQSMHCIPMGEDVIKLAREAFLTNIDNHFNLDPNLRIVCGCPCEVEETIPVPLLYPAFGQFMDESRMHIPTEEDNNVTYKLACVIQVLNGYSLCLCLKSKVPGTQYETDGVMCINFKNEASLLNLKPYMQALMYYLQLMNTYVPSLSGSSLPCLLVAIFGPIMLFAGAVWTLHPAIEPLSHPLTFNYYPKNSQNHATAGRHIAAFCNTVRTLQRHYKTLPPDDELGSNLFDHTIFPYPTSFTSLDDNSTIVFKYREHLDGDGGISKRLICSESSPIGMLMFNAIGEQLKMLHAHQLVHDNIHNTNILLKVNDRTKLMRIDFDWVGVDKVMRYPSFVNHRDIQRPAGARDGLPLEAAHNDTILGYTVARRILN